MEDRGNEGGALVPSPNTGTQDTLLLRLPNELLFHILRYLPLSSWLNFSLVCRRCCALARSPQAGMIAIDVTRYEYDPVVGSLSEKKPWHPAIGAVIFRLPFDSTGCLAYTQLKLSQFSRKSPTSPM
eukprot:comp13822_c1_seq1/m.9563 comp13822_c1_seq1/g.9563  ORF comp13822_c1_seq1/g.9563 comp13822_c1_seq1/m.9563 type:complete len:127 (-) comp13822_c1_seq1:137-517(-)